MSAPASPILRDCIDQFARQLAEAMHGREVPMRQVLEQKLAMERAAEKRKLLSLADERMGKHWADFCRVLYETLSRKALARAGFIEDDESDNPSTVSSLRLVDDDQMEWDLSLGGVGNRLHAAGAKALGQIDARVAALLKKQLDDDDFHNPLGPDTLVFALKKAVDVVAPESDLRRTLLLVIEPAFTECVVAQFEAANNLLADSGVEGVVRPKIVSAGGSRTAGSAGGSGGGASGAGGGGGGGGSSGGASGDVMAILQQLVQNSGGGAMGAGGAGMVMGNMAPGAGFGGMPPGMIAVPAAMLESLNRLQSLDLSALQAGSAEGGTVNVLRELRQQDVARSLPPIETVTIDIVATLFDFIFDDALVPDSVKALVGRLQIPMLKVAMLDKSFFSNKEHPARALLNGISKASIAAGKDVGVGNPVFDGIKSVVNRVLNEFEDDQSVFETLLPELALLVTVQEEESARLAERSKQVAEQQEQAEIAEIQAVEAYARILEQNDPENIPSQLAGFLERCYPLVLKRALLNGGTDGVAWAVATQTLSDLLWTVRPKATAEARQQMVSILPDLLRRLNAFFDKVGVPAEDKAAFINALAQVHSMVIKGPRKASEKKKTEADGKAAPQQEFVLPAAEVITSEMMSPTVVVTRIVQEDGLQVESMTVSGKASGGRTIRNAEVSALERGDWVEFIEEDGTASRARLSWVSPYRGVMLFANPQSSRAISINQEALAIQIKAGRARVLGDETMVDRALDKALETLKAA